MLGSPVATSEGGIGIITDVREKKKKKGKTSVIHFEGFLRGLGFTGKF
jgi:hypothetical protein